MNRYIVYIWYVVKHKWFVFLECCKLGIPWRGVLHDMSKFLPSEFIPYARFFYNPDGSSKQIRDKTGYYKPNNTGDAEFDLAWFYHKSRNKHHWQYWILPWDADDSHNKYQIQSHAPETDDTVELALNGKPIDIHGPYNLMLYVKNRLNSPICKPINIPMKYRLEMLADWRGAGRAQGKPDTEAWFNAHKGNMSLHADVRLWLESMFR